MSVTLFHQLFSHWSANVDVAQKLALFSNHEFVVVGHHWLKGVVEVGCIGGVGVHHSFFFDKSEKIVVGLGLLTLVEDTLWITPFVAVVAGHYTYSYLAKN